jgi:pyruvate kinase
MALTKIVATVGPSIQKKEIIADLIREGVDVFRFNLKHNDLSWHSEYIEKVQEVSQKIGQPVAVLLDLQGLNIRIGDIKELKVEKDKKFNFTIQKEKENDILVSESFFSAEIKKDNLIFIDEGKIKFKVLNVKNKKVEAKVLQGGVIKKNKSINIPDVDIDLPSLLEKDLRDLSLASKYEVDFIALSFVRNREDVKLLKKHLKKLSLSTQIIAKIETRQALDNFEDVLDVSDGIMIARGDLGIEIPLEEVPYHQKRIIKRCAEVGKPVITATQMLDSMTSNIVPSRAEVSDVANSVIDNTDAIMLSQETAVGSYPVETVRAMERIASFWETKRLPITDFDFQLTHQTAALCRSAFNLWKSPFCKKEKIKAFVVMTETGMTARMLARFRPDLPIIALTNNRKVRDQLCLSYGVRPLVLNYNDIYKKKNSSDIQTILNRIKESGYVKKGDKVIAVYGEDWGTPGKSSILRVQEIL